MLIDLLLALQLNEVLNESYLRTVLHCPISCLLITFQTFIFGVQGPQDPALATPMWSHNLRHHDSEIGIQSQAKRDHSPLI